MDEDLISEFAAAVRGKLSDYSDLKVKTLFFKIRSQINGNDSTNQAIELLAEYRPHLIDET